MKKPLPETAYAYLAGLLDGEGHICFSRRPNGRGKAVLVGCTNTDLTLLRPFHEEFGGTIAGPRVRGYGHKPQYEWRAYSKTAHAALLCLLPYLRRLGRKACYAIEIIELTPVKGQHLSTVNADRIAALLEQFDAQT